MKRDLLASALFATALLAAGISPAAAQVGGQVRCTCEGILRTAGSQLPLGTCGNGYAGGNPGEVVEGPLKWEGMALFLPPEDIDLLRVGNTSVYSPASGWRCERR